MTYAEWLQEADEELLTLCRATYLTGATAHPRRFLSAGRMDPRGDHVAGIQADTATLGPWTLTRRVWTTPAGYGWAEARSSVHPPNLPYVDLRSPEGDKLLMPVELVDVMRVARYTGFYAVHTGVLRTLARQEVRAVRATLDLGGEQAALAALESLGVRVHPGTGPGETFRWLSGDGALPL